MKRSSNSRIWKEARTRIAMSLSIMAVARCRLLDLLADGARFFLGIPGGMDIHLGVFRARRGR